MKIKWTPELDAALGRLQADKKLSYTEIAEQMSRDFNRNITRNACIGRSHRNLLPLRGKKPPPRTKPKVIPMPAPVLVKRTPRLVFSRQITIYELHDEACHWPEGDNPPYLYCGCRVAGGRPYCERHCRLAYASS